MVERVQSHGITPRPLPACRCVDPRSQRLFRHGDRVRLTALHEGKFGARREVFDFRQQLSVKALLLGGRECATAPRVGNGDPQSPYLAEDYFDFQAHLNAPAFVVHGLQISYQGFDNDPEASGVDEYWQHFSPQPLWAARRLQSTPSTPLRLPLRSNRAYLGRT
jgi:hypothetical protein